MRNLLHNLSAILFGYKFFYKSLKCEIQSNQRNVKKIEKNKMKKKTDLTF